MVTFPSIRHHREYAFFIHFQNERGPQPAFTVRVDRVQGRALSELLPEVTSPPGMPAVVVPPDAPTGIHAPQTCGKAAVKQGKPSSTAIRRVHRTQRSQKVTRMYRVT